MDEINPLSKFLSPFLSFICGEDTISVPGIVCGTIWGSFPVLGSFAVQFGDHLRYWDHLRAGVICGAVQDCNNSRYDLPLIKRQQPKQISKASVKLTEVSDRYLFSRLYFASQKRDGDLEEFFKHENQLYPPSLSEFGNLRFGKKSDLISCVNKETPPPPPPASYDVKVFDGAAIVHAFPVSSVATLSEYADSKFLTFLENHLKSTKRTEVVWDEYRVASLKESAREKRGKGVRIKVAGHVKLPQNWQAFLEDSSNKKELFDFLTKQVETADRVFYITQVRCYPSFG